MNDAFKHVSLFSGIGGQALACDWLGIPTVGFCEIDAWNRRVLAKHWPHARFHDDIKTLTGLTIRDWAGGRPDLITASWPCQPFSVAGKRRGRADDRALWPEVARIIDETRPRYFLGENVPGIISLELDLVATDLESLGYTCGAVVLPAGAVNALHRRERVWVMADAIGQRQPGPGPRQHARDPTARREGQAGDVVDGSPAGEGPEVARTLDARADGLPPGLVRRPSAGPTEPDLIRQAWADDSWEIGLPRVVTEETDRRQKLQAAGNAVLPVLVYEILRVMLGTERGIDLEAQP